MLAPSLTQINLKSGTIIPSQNTSPNGILQIRAGIVRKLKVGGAYFARMEAKDGSFGFDFEANYTEVTLGSSFTYTFGGRNCSVELKEDNDATQTTVTFDPETENPVEMQQQGWQAILNNFKHYTETH